MNNKKWLAILLVALPLPLVGCGGKKPAATPTPTRTAQATAAPSSVPSATPTEAPSKEEARGLIRRGMDKVLLGQASESLEILQKAYELDPENGEADYWLMKAYDLTEETHTPLSPAYPHAQRVLIKMQGGSHAQEAQDYISAAESGALPPASTPTPSPGKTPKPGKPSPKPTPKASKAAPPGDVAGFEKLLFGQTQDQVSKALGSDFRPYQGAKLPNLECFSIGRRNVGRYPYEVALGFKPDTTLKKVSLFRLWTTPATYIEYQALVDWTIEKYGPPHAAEDRPQPPMRSVTWEFPSAKIIVRMERDISMSIESNS